MAKPIVLTILDGWGYRAETHGNAIAQARKPTYDALLRDYPNTLLRASEHFVACPTARWATQRSVTSIWEPDASSAWT